MTANLYPRPRDMDRATFVERFGGVYEHSPWIAEQTIAAGLTSDTDTADGLAAALARTVEAATEEQKLALLRAHPDLAGKLAVAGALTKESNSEQAGAGLDQCTAEEFSRFQELNARYTERFGFPFILAVKGYDRQQVLAIFGDRVANNRDVEFREALTQVHRIASLRISALAENQKNSRRESK